jgi:hypothetical protein
MKLPDFSRDVVFNELRQRIGAAMSHYGVKIVLPKPVYKKRPEPKLEPLPPQGVEIDNFDQIKVNPDGTLGFGGRRVTLHIRDVSRVRGDFHIPRFHLAFCRTLEEMSSRGRFERYVVSDRDDEIFFIRVDSAPLTEYDLDVCQNCLDKLKWRGFSSDQSRTYRHEIVRTFTLVDFFKKYPRSLHSQLPQHTAQTAPVNEYPENWQEISDELRRQFYWTCQKCGLELGEQNKQWLHVHHRNGLRNDSSTQNLECLCLGCHASMPSHKHMMNVAFEQFKNKFPQWRF